MIHCRVLGPVEVTVNGDAPPPALLWDKHLALLVYLARSPKHGRSREHLIGLLWPDKSEQLARRSLNEALRWIRRCVGENELESVADQVRLKPGAVLLETEEFDKLAAAGDWHGAARLVGGIFLEGFAVAGASEFEEWLTAEQRAWSQRTVEALLRHGEAELAAGQASEAASAARRALDIDQCSEAAVRLLMTALVVDGNRTAALQEYDALVERLRRQLGISPSAETTALAERIRRERGPSVPQPTKSSAEPRRAPLVGRAKDLEALWAAWQSTHTSGTASAAMLAGDPGVGKTRLMDEMATRMRLKGAVTVVIRAVDSDLATPWSGVLGLARGGLLDAAGIAAAPPAALAWFAQRIAEWADRFPAARSIAPDPSPGAAFSEVLRAGLAEQPIALLVDDAETLDRDSLLALGAVLRDHATRPLAVLIAGPATAARAELDELQSRIGRDVNGVVVRLSPLRAEEIRALARRTFPSFDDAQIDRLTRRVNTDSAGLPLLVVELLSAVAHGLDLTGVRRAWPAMTNTLDETLPGGLPEGVVGAIRVEFRRLTEHGQRVLQVAAVVGPLVTSQLLVQVTGLAPDAVGRALDELEWSRWLTADGRGYRFVARIVRQSVEQDLLTEGQRRRILEAAGRAPEPA